MTHQDVDGSQSLDILLILVNLPKFKLPFKTFPRQVLAANVRALSTNDRHVDVHNDDLCGAFEGGLKGRGVSVVDFLDGFSQWKRVGSTGLD